MRTRDMENQSFLRVVEGLVEGSERAQSLAQRLFEASQWFQCEPLPDDGYRFTVKADAQAILATLLDPVESPSPQAAFATFIDTLLQEPPA